MRIKLQKPLVIFDIEATGMRLDTDRIVEIALIKLHPDGKREERVERFNPGIKMDEEVIAIHGIRNEDVQDSPKFKDLAEDLRLWLDGCDLGGYNSNRFDVPMLVEEFLRAGIGFDENRRYIDMQRIFMKMEPRTLGAALKFFCDKELEDAHEALADARATADVMEAQLERYEDKLPQDMQGLDRFSKEQDFVDFGRRMIYRNGKEVFHFGKHKGRPVEDVFRDEPSYYEWIQRGKFPLHTKLKIKTIWLRMQLQKKG
jgi:DNA polymerase-3 subunit epsilon